MILIFKEEFIMKLSKSGFKILNQRYRAVLRKCFLINVGLFFLSTPVMAEIVNDYISFER